MIEERPAAGELLRETPEAYIPSDRRAAIASGVDLPRVASGAALFADVSGFTSLTEALAAELGSQRASEELTAHLNRVFHALIEELDRFGGSVIYFSGDAVTCWVDGDDGLRAAAAALGMQEAIRREGRIATPAGLVVQLELKVAVAVGHVQRFVVGDPRILLIDVLAGAPLDCLAAAEEHAERGEVVLDAATVASLGERVVLAEMRPGGLGVVGELAVAVPPHPLPAPVRELTPDEVRPWLLPPVYERLCAGRGELLAELRPAIPLFLRFGGIDFDSDDAISRLDDFVCRAQRVVGRYGGSVIQLTIGDKGAYLYAIFGAPLAHEDDAARAVATASELRTLDGVSGIQIGISRGRLRSGTYGHALRRTYCCLGDAVNLAARLMSSAAPGQILADESVKEAAGGGYAWEPLPPLRLKGKSAPVAAFSLQGSSLREVRLESRYELPMLGRNKEFAAIAERLADAMVGSGQVVAITGEAGIGKSRLVAEAARESVEGGASVHAGECQAFGTNTSYFVWRPIWRALLRAEGGVAEVERALAEVDPELLPRLPLLSPLLGLPIPDNELTRSFDAKLRKESLEGLAAHCLRVIAAQRPRVFVLEDCHWLDPLSRDLLLALAREAARLPVAMLLAYRPTAEGEPGPGVEKLGHFREVRLAELPQDEAELLARSRFAQLFADERDAPARLVELVTARAQGNPFYIEELLSFIRSSGVDPHDDRALADLELPDSLHSMILSRIDTLDEQPRRTLKVASVVGRVFRVRTLPGAHPELGSLAEVRASLETLRAADLVVSDDERAEAYLFKHVITQQVAYESIPFATRATLHEGVGDFIESTEPSLDRHLNLLAHHYWLSRNDDKKRESLRRAGDAAQAEYANDVAIEWYRRLAPLLNEHEQGSVLLKLGKVLEHVGEWDEAGDTYEQTLALARENGERGERAWAETALGELARKRGRYDEATEWFDRAGATFDELGDLEGKGLVLHFAGTLAAQTGDYDASRRRYEASLEIRKRIDDKASLGGLYSNLGIIAEYVGDYERARALHEQGIAVRSEAGDKWGVSVSLNNLGNIARLQGDLGEARERLEQALQLQREVGDRWMIANVQNNLANVLREQGDVNRARSLYGEALQTYGDIADSWALAFLFEDVAALAASTGAAEEALLLAGAAETRRAEIGTPRSPTDAEKLDLALAPARGALDEAEQRTAVVRGQMLALEDAVDAALRICRASYVEA